MTEALPLLVFTDLDGTLLDHETYSWSPALNALGKLRNLGAGVILASSKTSAEIAPLRDEMGLSGWPAIIENGAAQLPAHQAPVGGNAASGYADLRHTLSTLPKDLRTKFRGFGDMTDQQVCDVTGLPLSAARLAKQRTASEPGEWTGSDSQRTEFLAALSDVGLTARMGGRFLTVTTGQTKADQMAEIIRNLKPQKTVALGDAPNDVEMLEAADIGIIVANPHRPPLPQLAGEPMHIRRTELAGPIGWNAAILAILNELNLTGDT